MRTTMALETGVLRPLAMLLSGTSTFRLGEVGRDTSPRARECDGAEASQQAIGLAGPLTEDVNQVAVH